MKTKIVFLVLFSLLADLALAQVKFRVKKLNTDSLAALILEKEGTELVEVLNLLSNAICRKNIDSSILLATQAIDLSEKLEYQKGLADGYLNVGNGYFLLDSLQPTISNYLKALRIYEDLEPSEAFGNLCMQLSMVNYFTGRMDDSQQYNKQALSIYYKIDDKMGKSIASVAIATWKYVINKEFDSAIYYCNRAFTFIDPAIHQTEVAFIYSELGRIHYEQFGEINDPSYLTRALSMFSKGLELTEMADEAKAYIYLGMGRAYVSINSDSSISKGIECYQKVVKIANHCFDAYDLKNHALEMLGWTFYEREDYNKAIYYFNQAIKIIDERSDVSINDYKEPILGYNWKYYHKVNRKDIYRGLYYIYDDRGDYKQALEHYALYQEAEKEIYKENNQKMITMLESVSKDEKTEKQLALLAKDNELKELAIKQSRTYLFALGGFILILVLVTLLFFRQRKIRMEHKIFVREQKLLHDLELKNMESGKLKDLDSMKSRFFANISHEFRTPLTLIKGPLDKVLSESEVKNHKKELGVAKKYTGKLQVLINNLLTISKLESGKMELRASETDVVKLVGTYIQSFESLAKQKNIALDFKAEDENVNAYIDREKFEQVLNNLLSNAIKFTEKGGEIKVQLTPQYPPFRGERGGSVFEPYKADETPSVSKGQTELTATPPTPPEGGDEKGGILRDSSDSQSVSIKISDTGRGIPSKHLPHIFDRFYQVGNEDNNYYEGTGIGLALTKELVELHHGEIKVESEHGNGTTFTIILPLGSEHLKDDEVVDQDETPNREPVLPVTSNQQLSFAKASASDARNQSSFAEASADDATQSILLIVEDNADMRSYIRGYFETEYHIIEAVDGADGYEKATEHIPDIIISDVMMPNMDGNEFCEKVKTDERTSHIPVVLLTARASKESRMEGLETGADDFITKPFDGDELQVRINNLIEQRKRLNTVLDRKIQGSLANTNLVFEDSSITSMDDKFLQKANAVVMKNLSNPEYTMEEFASAMAFSRVQLHRKLKALVGISSTEFIRTIRLNYAKGLLQKKAGTISEIAYDSGFNNPNYFSKIFRQKYGMSPSEYQNNIG